MNRSIRFYSQKNRKISINKKKWIGFIELLGFRLYYPNKDQYVFVKIENSIVEKVTISQIKNETLCAVDLYVDAYRDKVQEKILNSVNTLFSKGLLETLPTFSEKFIKSTETRAFTFFKNGFVPFIPELKHFVIAPYNQLPGYIWKDQIVNRDFPTKLTKDKSEFEVFIEKVSGNDPKRKASLESIIGYMLHTYKDPSNPKAVILYDDPDGSLSPNGRRGKGIILVAVGCYLLVAKEDGKLFSTKANFIFQQVDINTQILFLDDVPISFDMQKLFSVVSEGITIEKKFEPKFTLRYNDSPKVVITSNYQALGKGESYEGRRIEFGLSPYFSSKWTPKQEFGHLLFEGWGKEEWGRFDFYMMSLLKRYLETGIIICNKEVSPYERLATETSKHFSDFCKKYISDNTEYSTAGLYSHYDNEYSKDPAFSKVSSNMFTRWLKVYASYLNLKMTTRESSGSKYVTFM